MEWSINSMINLAIISKKKKKGYRKMNKTILITALIISAISTTLLADSGYYLTRKSPFQSNKELESRATNIRDLITDCLERSISLSCHRAGIWLIKHNDKPKGLEYLKNSCELGRGYSCRVVADYMLDKMKFTQAKEYYKKGCYRYDDKKSCSKMLIVPNPPKPKPITAMEKLDRVLK